MSSTASPTTVSFVSISLFTRFSRFNTVKKTLKLMSKVGGYSRALANNKTYNSTRGGISGPNDQSVATASDGGGLASFLGSMPAFSGKQRAGERFSRETVSALLRTLIYTVSSIFFLTYSTCFVRTPINYSLTWMTNSPTKSNSSTASLTVSGFRICQPSLMRQPCPFLPSFADHAKHFHLLYILLQFSSSTRQTFGVQLYSHGKRFVQLFTIICVVYMDFV